MQKQRFALLRRLRDDFRVVRNGLRTFWQRLVGSRPSAAPVDPARSDALGLRKSAPSGAAPTLPPLKPAAVSVHRERAHSAKGRLRLAPFVQPARNYELRVPTQISASPRLLLLLHGCKQRPDEFAAAARIDQMVERGDWLVLMPAQVRTANLSGCWNWFDHETVAGRGEVAIVLAALDDVMTEHAIDKRKVFIGGMSSGAALAAAIIAHAPTRFAGAAFHSGLPFRATRSPLRARSVMTKGPDHDVTLDLPAIGRLPALVIHGCNDKTVAPVNADALLRQLLAINGDIAPGDPLPTPDAIDQKTIATRTARIRHFGKHQQMLIDGLGHAWSGGDPAWRFNDPLGPDATATMLQFFDDVTVGEPAKGMDS